jgi:hypothetical protein
MKQQRGVDGERALLVAVILRACEDATGHGPYLDAAGSEAARAWLAGDGAAWADAMGICEPTVVQAWAACPGELPKLSELYDKKGNRRARPA